MHLRIRDDLDEGTMEIPPGAAEGYTIPAELPYRICAGGSDLRIGPVIAVVVRGAHLSPRRLRRWEKYCKDYPQIGGLLVFCIADGIDAERRLIRGFAYRPHAAPRWVPGVYPFPDAMYRMARMKKRLLIQLQTALPGKLFNARRFTKWEMWETLSRAGFSRLPHTERLTGLPVLERMVRTHNSVYIKPIDGLFGNRIFRLVPGAGGYVLKDGKGKTAAAGSLEEVFRKFCEGRNPEDYLVQRDVSRYVENKLVDFRVIVQKDGRGKWTCPGMIARTGQKEGIITNTVSDLCFASEALRGLFGFAGSKAERIEREIRRMCIEAAAHMEQAYGTYGDLGMDVALDPQDRLWLLEINIFHQHNLANDLEGGAEMYRRVTANPLLFANYLSGFGRA